MEHEKIFKKIAAISKKSKLPVYVVGGFVRDLFLDGVEKKDYDFVVEGSGLAFAKLLDDALKQEGSLIEFPDFDTARYVVGEGEKKVELEFAGARSETYTAHSRKPLVSETTLQKDLERRDFTVNAMAIPMSVWGTKIVPNQETLIDAVIDPFAGKKDLAAKILRTPLDPDTTFSEDPLRMLRAIRFAAQLCFAIDPVALEAIHRNRERIKIVSGERIQEELLKLLKTPEPSVGLLLMFQTKLMDIVLPEISALDGVEDVYGHSHKNNLYHTFKVVDNIALRSNNVWLRLAGLLHDIGKPATKRFVPRIGWTFHAHEHVGRKMVMSFARRLRLSTENTNYLAKLVRWHMQPIALMDEGVTDSAVRRLIFNSGAEINDLLILGKSDITTGNPQKKVKRLANYDHLEARVVEVTEKDKMLAFQSPVRGEEIMEMCKLKPGPTVGKIKTALEEAILDGLVPNEHDLVQEYFMKIKDEYLAAAADWERI